MPISVGLDETFRIVATFRDAAVVTYAGARVVPESSADALVGALALGLAAGRARARALTAG